MGRYTTRQMRRELYDAIKMMVAEEKAMREYPTHLALGPPRASVLCFGCGGFLSHSMHTRGDRCGGGGGAGARRVRADGRTQRASWRPKRNKRWRKLS